MRVLRIIELVVPVSHMLVRVTWQGRSSRGEERIKGRGGDGAVEGEGRREGNNLGNNEEFQPLK